MQRNGLCPLHGFADFALSCLLTAQTHKIRKPQRYAEQKRTAAVKVAISLGKILTSLIGNSKPKRVERLNLPDHFIRQRL